MSIVSKPKGVTKDEEVVIPAGSVRLYGILGLPPHAKGVVVFAHGSGSGRFSPTFAIRGEKRLFLGMNRHETLDFKGVDIQNGL